MTPSEFTIYLSDASQTCRGTILRVRVGLEWFFGVSCVLGDIESESAGIADDVQLLSGC